MRIREFLWRLVHGFDAFYPPIDRPSLVSGVAPYEYRIALRDVQYMAYMTYWRHSGDYSIPFDERFEDVVWRIIIRDPVADGSRAAGAFQCDTKTLTLNSKSCQNRIRVMHELMHALQCLHPELTEPGNPHPDWLFYDTRLGNH